MFLLQLCRLVTSTSAYRLVPSAKTTILLKKKSTFMSLFLSDVANYFRRPWYSHHSSQLTPHSCCPRVLPIFFVYIPRIRPIQRASFDITFQHSLSQIQWKSSMTQDSIRLLKCAFCLVYSVSHLYIESSI